MAGTIDDDAQVSSGDAFRRRRDALLRRRCGSMAHAHTRAAAQPAPRLPCLDDATAASGVLSLFLSYLKLQPRPLSSPQLLLSTKRSVVRSVLSFSLSLAQHTDEVAVSSSSSKSVSLLLYFTVNATRWESRAAEPAVPEVAKSVACTKPVPPSGDQATSSSRRCPFRPEVVSVVRKVEKTALLPYPRYCVVQRYVYSMPRVLVSFHLFARRKGNILYFSFVERRRAIAFDYVRTAHLLDTATGSKVRVRLGDAFDSRMRWAALCEEEETSHGCTTSRETKESDSSRVGFYKQTLPASALRGRTRESAFDCNKAFGYNSAIGGHDGGCSDAQRNPGLPDEFPRCLQHGSQATAWLLKDIGFVFVAGSLLLVDTELTLNVCDLVFRCVSSFVSAALLASLMDKKQVEDPCQRLHGQPLGYTYAACCAQGLSPLKNKLAAYVQKFYRPLVTRNAEYV
ncbi:hypothetical protein HPB51_020748 [Rhipicephalus microplus]|uniref:Uncharacterized protein n=1 Tax=Rhipicephalus microplus TaxID=6941 RepID=A0A9J6DPX0_RHIMP|nr:hypothetical protein HPB51_020748 [Rhipicephalus microplus]